jgi:hypothetical protein
VQNSPESSGYAGPIFTVIRRALAGCTPGAASSFRQDFRAGAFGFLAFTPFGATGRWIEPRRFLIAT